MALTLDEAASRAWIWLGDEPSSEASLGATRLETLGMVWEMRSASILNGWMQDVPNWHGLKV